MDIMKLKSLVDGLTDIINDHVEGELDPATERMFIQYLKKNRGLASFIKKSYEGKIALKKAYEVKAADDFEEKLAKRIAEEQAKDQER